VRVQEQPLQAEGPQLAGVVVIAVFLVARDRMACPGGMHADLVGSARQQSHLNQRREIAEELHRPEF
jgi:hypothetical protein